MEKNNTQEPKYKQLSDLLRQKIENGEYARGEKLDSENELASAFHLSRQTVRQALSVLTNEGILIRQKGSGTFVSPPMPRQTRTMNVGVITTYITDYIFPSITRGIEEELSAKGYNLSLGATKNKVENEGRILQSFIENNVDGIIVEGTKTALPNPNIGLYKKLDTIGIPYVFINGYYRELSPVYVITDDRAAGRQSAEYLANQLGHRRIGGIFKSDDMQGHERYAGFSEGLLRSGRTIYDDAVVWYTTADLDYLFSEQNEQNLLERLRHCSGVVCYNDQIAYKFIEVLRKHSLSVPQQISVIGFDNSRISELSPVKITSFNHPKDKLGRLAAEKLIKMIETGVREPSQILELPLVVKDSTALFKKL